MVNGVKKPCMGNLLVSNHISRNHKRILRALLLWTVLAVAPATVVFAVAPAIAVDDDYLKALESEADDTGSLTIKPGNNPNAASSNSKAKENFEKLLEFELPSTYKFYTKLNPNDQNKVVRHYSKEKKMSAASKLIFDLYFESNQ